MQGLIDAHRAVPYCRLNVMTSSGTVYLGHYARLCGSNKLIKARREFNDIVHYGGHLVSISTVQL